MKESGYHENMRSEVIRRGIETYERQLQNDINGICPLHRPKGYEKGGGGQKNDTGESNK